MDKNLLEPIIVIAEKKILIQGDEWAVKMVDKLPAYSAQEFSDNEDCKGFALTDEYIIYIRESEAAFITIVHEIYHAYFSYCNIESTNEMTIGDAEEVAAETISKNILKILSNAIEVINEFDSKSKTKVLDRSKMKEDQLFLLNQLFLHYSPSNVRSLSSVKT